MTSAAKRPARERPRTPKGKRQMLSIIDENVIEAVKIAAIKKKVPMSHIVQQAIEDWLARNAKA